MIKRDSASAQEEFRFAHLSDIHIISPTPVKARELLNKRLYGYISWRVRRHAEHRAEIIAALLDHLRSARPDHIVITGDLTHLGLPGEFREAAELLRSLGPPAMVTAVPGNHDAYVSTSWQNTTRLWAEYMDSDAEELSGEAGSDPGNNFPIVRVRGPIAFIGVSTARPTRLFLATAALERRNWKSLKASWRRPGAEGSCAWCSSIIHRFQARHPGGNGSRTGLHCRQWWRGKGLS